MIIRRAKENWWNQHFCSTYNSAFCVVLCFYISFDVDFHLPKYVRVRSRTYTVFGIYSKKKYKWQIIKSFLIISFISYLAYVPCTYQQNIPTYFSNTKHKQVRPFQFSKIFSFQPLSLILNITQRGHKNY